MASLARPNPKAFRQSVDSGLYLPPEISRSRTVWTRDEWRLLERCATMLARHGVKMQMQCKNPPCHAAPLEASRLRDGSFQLQCACTTHVMVKAF